MTHGYGLGNLMALSVQIAVLVGVGLLLPRLLRLRTPLGWGQLLLALALFLPFLQPWRAETIEVAAPQTRPEAYAPAEPGPAAAAPASIPLETAAFAVLAGGVLLRVLWLLLGMARLRRYRTRSTPLAPLPAVETARRLTGATADFRTAAGLGGPVTFGFLRPVVLTPPNFSELDEAAQLAIACHELLHVRRRDWLASLAEEFAAALLWFHPAVWWLLAQIRLSREETVDRAVIALTEAREPYVTALLRFAGGPGDLDCAPAPPFLGKDHLVQRIRTLMKEVRMSHRRRIASLGAATAVLAAAGWTTVNAFPLKAPPRYRLASPPVALQTQAAPSQTPREVVRSGEIRSSAVSPISVAKDAVGRPVLRPYEYPPAARDKKIEGDVVIELQFNPSGELIDARVLSGPDELRAAAMRRALQPVTLPERTARLEVVVPFKLEDAPPRPASPFDSGGVLRRVDVSKLAVEDQNRVRPMVAPYEGREMSRKTVEQLLSELRPVLAGVNLSLQKDPSANEFTVLVLANAPPVAEAIPANPPDRIRVGAYVQAAKLIQRAEPAYPPLAQQARIQGTVRFQIVIGKEGDVKNIMVESGHPLLVPAALAALKQWTYQPTLLNGTPVEVITNVDLSFVLPPGA